MTGTGEMPTLPFNTHGSRIMTDTQDITLPPLDILLVEDESIIRRVVSAFLRNDGHTVTMAEDGHAALAALERQDFDVVVMDVHMPGMNGLEACRAIRALPDSGRAGIPILALTTPAVPEDEALVMAAGADGLLTKPATPTSLRAAIATLFSPETEAAPQAAQEDLPVFRHGRIAEMLEVMNAETTAALFAQADQSLHGLTAALAAPADTAEQARLAHRLAGVASTYGCLRLGALARRIEAAAKGEGIEALADLLAALPELAAASMAGLSQARAALTRPT
ncbi:MAG: response regulator [Rhodospirillales bacterium]|nr:response regulator [Rhodospirillales bacterium]